LIKLPEEFEQKMLAMLGPEEYKKYQEALAEARASGLRANRLKLSKTDLRTLTGDTLELREDVPWCDDGIFFNAADGSMPGRSAYYLAGLYYIQEPSAMYPAANAGIRPGMRVLDMCAAPGGKSARAASDLQGEGLLVANDISESRAGTLLYNLELAGVRNALVTNASPAELEARFGQFFDVILIDAPCSGEGMFRKDENALSGWESFRTGTCTEMQREILAHADGLLKPGGRLVYSTCTFDARENELMLAEFIAAHPEYRLLPLPKTGGVADGFSDPWKFPYAQDVSTLQLSDAEKAAMHLEYTARLWPTRLPGEGQFCGMLEKASRTVAPDADDVEAPVFKTRQSSYKKLKTVPEELRAFAQENFRYFPFETDNFYLIRDSLFACPFEPLNIDLLKVLRMGVHVGELNHGKLKPAQHFVMTLPEDVYKRTIELDPAGDQVKRYLRGESLETPGAANGITAVRVAGHTLGLGDVRGGILKNLYAKGWRRII